MYKTLMNIGQVCGNKVSKFSIQSVEYTGLPMLGARIRKYCLDQQTKDKIDVLLHRGDLVGFNPI